MFKETDHFAHSQLDSRLQLSEDYLGSRFFSRAVFRLHASSGRSYVETIEKHRETGLVS